MKPIQTEIECLFAGFPDVLCGYADIAYSAFARAYRAAVVFAVPYGKQLTAQTYSEQAFEDGIQSARLRLEAILARLEALLQASGTAYCVPPVAQESEADLLAPFSFKFAATRAGLGWIGKNDVLVTDRYGPRVRLSAVLVDAPLECGRPVNESRCPDDCKKCFEICPCRALRGVQWNAGLHRAELIDYHRCNRMRSALIPKLGRKSACGLCLAVCPFGTDEAPDSHSST